MEEKIKNIKACLDAHINMLNISYEDGDFSKMCEQAENIVRLSILLDMMKDCKETDMEQTTTMTDGITECCGYDFGVDGFGNKNSKIKFCPSCGKRIVIR